MEDVDESYFDWSDEEDIICSSKYISSDEEDFDLATTLALKAHQQGKSVFRSKQKQDEGDDFEKEMASELSQTMRHLTSSLGVPGSSAASNPTEGSQKAPEFYDDIYFDSDESDTEETTPAQASKGKKRKQSRRHKMLSNDELFYDPTMDDRDQEWVNQKRRSYQPRGRRAGRTLGVENNNTIQLPPSDAVLNCPACLTTLCMDCQRHEIYHNQYRAMFVFNCTVDVTERLSYPRKDQKKQDFLKNKKARRNKNQGDQLENKLETETAAAAAANTSGSTVKVEETPSANQSINPTTSNSQCPSDASTTKTDNNVDIGKDLYHPVMCKICNTKVAVYDSDEVYHFFNVVTSY